MNNVTIVTHSGRFHADDIFAVAAIYLFLERSDFPAWRNKAVSVVRTRDESKMLDATFVVDVGGVYDEKNNRFDHHQVGGAGTRPNGIPYAGFGLVWKKYGEHICGSSAVASAVDEKLVQLVDARDNGFQISTQMIEGVEPYCVDDFFASFMPTWKESEETLDATFQDLVIIARELIKREIKIAEASAEARVIIEKSYGQAEDRCILVLDEYMPWKDAVAQYAELLFVVYPVHDGTWHVSAVPQEKGRMFKNKKDFPRAWAGKRDAELQTVAGVSDAKFCHNGLFLAVAQSRQGAIELAKKAVRV